MSDKLYQPYLPFSPRLRFKPSRGIVKRFLDSEFIAEGRLKMTDRHVGYRTSTGRYYLNCFDHKERTPSLCISPRRRGNDPTLYYHCYGCGISGSMASLGHQIKRFGYKVAFTGLTVGLINGRFMVISANHGTRPDSESNNIPGRGWCSHCLLPVEQCDCDIPF